MNESVLDLYRERSHGGLLSQLWRAGLLSVCMVVFDGTLLDGILILGRRAWGLSLSANAFELLLAAVWLLPLGLWALGAYPGYALHAVLKLRKRAYTLSLAFLLLVLYLLVGKRGGGEAIPGLCGCYALAFFAWPIGSRIFERVLRIPGWWGEPVVVLGAGEQGHSLVRSLRQEGALGLIPTAFYDDDPDKIGRVMAGLPVLGSLAEAGEANRWARIAILAIPSLTRETMGLLVPRLPFPRLLILPNIEGVQTLWLRGADLGGRFCLDVRKKQLLLRNQILKRTLDLVCGVPIACLCAPVILILAILVRRRSPGPVFYAQERIGRGGRVIRMWKLRTMFTDSAERLERHLATHPEAKEEWERRFKLADDPRILPQIGRFLRRSSLDELPQIWNVLKGEMSLVGPRPFPQYHLDAFSEEFRKLRSSVAPGMTGLWQVSAREDGDLENQERMDTYYILNWSLWQDVDVLLKTATVVVRGTGT